MEAGATFDMSAFGPCPVVHSICLSSDGTKLLVGVKGCEVRVKPGGLLPVRGNLKAMDGVSSICGVGQASLPRGIRRVEGLKRPSVLSFVPRQIYEVSAADGSDLSGGPITTSHFDGQLTGLARHPQRAEYATAGGDGTVSFSRCRWWCLRRRLPRWLRLVFFSPNVTTGEIRPVVFLDSRQRKLFEECQFDTLRGVLFNQQAVSNVRMQGKTPFLLLGRFGPSFERRWLHLLAFVRRPRSARTATRSDLFHGCALPAFVLPELRASLLREPLAAQHD